MPMRCSCLRPSNCSKPPRQPYSALIALLYVLELSQTHVALAADPLRVEVQRDAQGLVVKWAGEGSLEMATQVMGPWTRLAEAKSPHRVNPLAQSTFYRVQQRYTVTAARTGSGTGSLVSIPAGVVCGDDCSEAFAAGQTITLQAKPDPGSTFAGWTGDCSGTGDCTLLMDRARSVTATFQSAPAANPFVNGDFEQGPAVGWQQAPGQVIYPAASLGGIQPHSGQYAAYLGFEDDGRRQVRLGQRIQLPNRQPLFLNFAAWLYSKELCDVPWYDRFTIYLNDQAAFQEDRICQGSGTDGWVRYSFDVTAIAGQSVALVFEMYSADALWSWLLLDDIAIADKAWAQ